VTPPDSGAGHVTIVAGPAAIVMVIPAGNVKRHGLVAAVHVPSPGDTVTTPPGASPVSVTLSVKVGVLTNVAPTSIGPLPDATSRTQSALPSHALDQRSNAPVNGQPQSSPHWQPARPSYGIGVAVSVYVPPTGTSKSHPVGATQLVPSHGEKSEQQTPPQSGAAPQVGNRGVHDAAKGTMSQLKSTPSPAIRTVP
jgi:hypothetical protein